MSVPTRAKNVNLGNTEPICPSAPGARLVAERLPDIEDDSSFDVHGSGQMSCGHGDGAYVTNRPRRRIQSLARLAVFKLGRAMPRSSEDGCRSSEFRSRGPRAAASARPWSCAKVSPQAPATSEAMLAGRPPGPECPSLRILVSSPEAVLRDTYPAPRSFPATPWGLLLLGCICGPGLAPRLPSLAASAVAADYRQVSGENLRHLSHEAAAELVDFTVKFGRAKEHHTANVLPNCLLAACMRDGVNGPKCHRLVNSKRGSNAGSQEAVALISARIALDRNRPPGCNPIRPREWSANPGQRRRNADVG